ncbi:MAG: Gfo/Idh/MocA family oxidoreductase [Opitutae bacterium]|nr:Gfo/Idh/MocA family oxidoreductase [Opitutae bacterium]
MKTYKTAAEIKVGVIGYGGAFNMGRQHLQQMQAAGMTPVAVAEVDAARLAVAAQDFPGIETYASVSELLRKSSAELMVLITPHNTHAALAVQCLKAGRHVVCEKPLAITTAEVDRMIATAKRSGVMLSTYHNRHWDGRILLATDLIKKQKLIGDIVRIECHMGGYSRPLDWWRSSRSISGGILYDWGVHLLEYSLQLIEAPIAEVSGFASSGFWGPQIKWKDDANDDEGFAVVRFQGSQWLTLAITHIDSKAKDGFMEITGTKGTLVLDDKQSTLYQHIDGRSITTRLPNPADEGHRYYENVRDHLVRRAPLTITAEWSRRPIHILDLATQSAKKGRALPAKYG